MKPGVPWSVKGIEPQVREAAKTAARRAGMTVGEWLNSVILDQNEYISDSTPSLKSYQQEDFVSASSDSPDPALPVFPHREERQRPSASARRDDSAMRLQDIAQQLADLAQKERQSAAIQPFSSPQDRRAEEEALARLVERIDDTERQTVEAFTAVNERLSLLGQQIAHVPRAHTFDRPEDVPGYSVLESAIRNVVEHIEMSERRTRDALQAMQDRLGELAEQAAERTHAEEAHAASPLLVNLEGRLADFASRLQRTEGLVQKGMPEAVTCELTLLANRIEGVQSSSAEMARQAQSSAVTAARGELREIEARVLAMLHEAQAASAYSSAAPDIAQLRDEIGGLARSVDEIRTAAAAERDLNALRIAVEQLSTRVAQGADMRPLAEMDRRLGELGRRLDRADAIEERIAGLDQRLQEAMGRQDDPSAVSALAQNIAAVSERVGRTEEQLRHVETMERAIRQLYEGLEHSKETSSRAADEAATRAVERLLPAGAPEGPSQELKALEEGLRAVRESAAGAERRNQETLAAVHETLSQIIDKISEMEAGSRSDQQPQPEAISSATAEFGYAQNEEDGAAAADGGAEPLSSTDDFIAAARRAAQAAASRPSALRAEVGSFTQPPSEERGFSLLRRFRKPNRTPQPPHGQSDNFAGSADQPKGKASASQADRRRRLLLAGIVLLTAVAAFAVNMIAKEGPGTPPATIEAPASKAPADATPPAPADGTPAKPATTGSLLPVWPSDPLITSSLPEAKTEAGSAQSSLPLPETGPDSLRTAAAGGKPNAQFIVASRYLEGEGVEPDPAKAAYWYEKAALRGLAPAQYRLGSLYERGTGVPQDAATALKWYEQAAWQGNVKALHNAAVLLAGDQAGSADYGKAFRFFREAARHGLRDSQFNLAILYERGLGTGADKTKAYFWYRLAAQQGDSDAESRAAVLATSMNGDALTQLAKRLASWAPEPGVNSANVVSLLDPSWSDPQTSVREPGAAAPLSQAPSANPVAEAQELLGRLGFNIGTPDGKMGSRTSSALKLFQLKNGLAVTGEITPDMLDAMRARAV